MARRTPPRKVTPFPLWNSIGARWSSASPMLPIRGRSARAPRQPGCSPLALYTAAALGSARKSISAFAAIGCSDTYGAPAT